MINSILITFLFLVFSSCKERTEEPENSRGIPGPTKVEAEALDIVEHEDHLHRQDFQTLRQREGDDVFFLEESYLIILKKGENDAQNANKIKELKRQHFRYWEKISEEDLTILSGRTGEDQDIMEVLILRVGTQRMADSIATGDPMVKAEVLKVEILPFWLRTINEVD